MEARAPDAALLARRRTRVALATTLVLLVALAAIAIFATDRLYSTADERYAQEAVPLRGLSRDLILQMVNEETAVRGYLITGKRGSLGPYVAAQPRVRSDLAGLKRLAQRRPDITQNVADVERQVDALERYFRGQVALVEQGGDGQLRAQRNVLGGQARFDRLRLSGRDLLDRAEQILRQARSSQRTTFLRALVLILVVAGIAAAITAVMLLVVPERMRRLYRGEQDARRAAERGAKASSALEHVNDAVVLLDDEDSIRYWNPAAEAAFGTAEDDALERPAAEVFDLGAVEQALARGGDGSLVPIARDGEDRWHAVTESRFQDGRVLVLRDVTSEQQLEHARAEFLATASHELRTPLAAIYGAVRTLRRPEFRDQPELRERLLDIAEQESDRLASLVDQILVSAKLDRRELRVDRQPVELRELCESVVESARLRTTDAHPLKLEGPARATVEADPARLRQVLANLVDNALKYSPAGGAIELRIGEGEERTAITVADHGIGIPAEAQKRVFEKFYRVDPDMLGGVGGSGLGLYISRELVEQMDGTLTVRSGPGGSIFTVELPRATGSVDAAPADPAGEPVAKEPGASRSPQRASGS